ncbi:Trk system potassium transporter TrkA [Dorea acetigenes]|uniref:Trk system potassium uptake protein TrkA n=1 Tax=Dorea acetigenes TaxID=2981787 RepID=A0ABT2RRP4_9FIRM|nr:Trk system potassium transporter TrkA [Dorea acetigenes]MCB6415834.1 Trk system potassium transporter TrkA [Faecalimonas umbilicata]MCU6688089.1 Trk system potassium transporter TrkA [Dorea acetigenes]SCJ65331.1 Trk system potassium uptake protein trkA [uncultured Clostridium sp.]
MKIVIIGDGKVGHKLTAQLSEEDYDVVLIDQNEGKLKSAIDNLDIFCITGDGANAEIQKEADVPHADLVIACASTDELNMLSCLLAKRLGAKHTIARVRNPVYYKQMGLLKEDLRLSMAVNPEYAVANEIARVLLFPDASKVETFVKGRVELIEFALKEESRLVGLSLAEIYQKYQIKILVCAVKRGKDVYIPDGDFLLQAGDKIYVAATHKDLESFFNALGKRSNKVKNVLICGGGRVSYYLAQQLLQARMRVKIIEQNRLKCENLSEMLPEATVICGDATDYNLLKEEGIEYANALVALTGMDEENIIMALFGKTQNVPKIVAKVNEDSRAQMVEGLGIDSIVSAKSATADAILSYVRARKKSLKSANIETMYRLVGDRVEALEFIIRKECEYTNIPLKNLSTKQNNLIACIGRRGKIIIPNGDDHMEVGDSVVVINMDQKINDLRDIML